MDVDRLKTKIGNRKFIKTIFLVKQFLKTKEKKGYPNQSQNLKQLVEVSCT